MHCCADPSPPPLVFMQRMVAVASRALRHASTSPSLSFWKHARGSDPFGSNNGYTGSYTGARNSRGGVSGAGGGTSGHWAVDTNVENPHGSGCEVCVCVCVSKGGPMAISSLTYDVRP